MAHPTLQYIASYCNNNLQVCLENQWYHNARNCPQLLPQIPQTTTPTWEHLCDPAFQSKKDHVASAIVNHEGGRRHGATAFILPGADHIGDNPSVEHDNNQEFPMQEP